jgi:hypothetical protein
MAAGDSTEFTAKITVDSKQAEQNVQNLGDQTEETGEKFVSLRSQIRQTTVELQKLETEGKTATKEFEKLRSKLDDLNDAQERAAFKAGQFDDKLAALPGPLGQAGGALKTFNESVNQFGKTLTLSLGLVGLVVTAFLAVKNALEKTESGQKLLSKATEAFNKILAPVFVILQKIGEFVLPKLIKGFELVGKAVEKVASIFGDNKDRIKEMNAALQENNEYANDLAAKEKKRADDAQALADKKKAEQDKRDAAEKKRRDDLKQARDKAAAEQLEFEKAQMQSAIELLDGREKEQAALAVQYHEQRLKYKDRSAAELLVFDEAYQKKRVDIDKKYEDERLAKLKKDQDDEIKALDEFYKKQEDLKRYKDFSALQSEIETLSAANQLRDDDFQADLARNELAQERLLQQMQLEMDAAKGTEDAKIKEMEIRKKYGDALIQLEKDNTNIIRAEMQARTELQLSYANVVGQAGKILGQLAGENKELAIVGLVVESAAAIASIAINAKRNFVKDGGIKSPLAWANVAVAGLQALSVGIATKKGIDAIKAAGGPSSGGGGGGGSASPPTIEAPRVGNAAEPQMAEGVGANPSSQIAQTIGNAQSQPVRAYVVSQDITSQQMLDRKSNQAAVF